MEKRFVAFVLISVLIMAGFMGLQFVFGPKREPKKPIPLAKKDEDGEKKPGAEKKKPGGLPPGFTTIVFWPYSAGFAP